MGTVHGRTGAGRPLWPWHRTKAWQIVKEVMRAADVRGPHASPKGLRHAFGVNAVLSGVPLPVVQKWLGHESPETTAIYTNVLVQKSGRSPRGCGFRACPRSDL